MKIGWNKEKRAEELLECSDVQDPCRHSNAACSDSFFTYCASMIGASHIQTGDPCQDCCDTRIVKVDGRDYVISAVADGVGSCALSHFGSAAAVLHVMDYCTAKIGKAAAHGEQGIKTMLQRAFRHACEEIEALAELQDQISMNYLTTLTVTVCSEDALYIGHIGDCGVAALVGEDRSYRLLTARHKGEDASSVYPLQCSEDKWQFLGIHERVEGFILATDGVLDSFVTSGLYGERVYPPFLNAFLFRDIDSKRKTDGALKDMMEYLDGSSFRERVSDDITVVVVGNIRRLYHRKPPSFDRDQWDRCIEERDAQIRKALYGYR